MTRTWFSRRTDRSWRRDLVEWVRRVLWDSAPEDGPDGPEAGRPAGDQVIASSWQCSWCGDHFDEDDEDVPPVCLMCGKAGRR